MLVAEHFKTNGVPNAIYEFIAAKNYVYDDDLKKIYLREIKFALCQQANGKDAGFDNLDAIVVKNICNKFSDLVCAICNKCMARDIFRNAGNQESLYFLESEKSLPNQIESTVLSLYLSFLEKSYV